MVALAIEIGRGSRDRSALSRYISRLIDRVIPGFRWSGRSAKRDQAILMIAAMTGAVILARAVDDGKLSDEILAATQRQLLSS
jgi:TetR/AcrR family transcriptional repressor of nem operon